MPFKKADIDESMEEDVRTRSGVSFFTVPAPDDPKKFKSTRVRILPPRSDHPTNKFYYWVCVHRNLPGTQRQVVCNAKMENKPCRICDEVAKIRQIDKDAAYKMRPQWKAMMNLVVLKSDGTCEDKTIKVYGPSKGNFEDLKAKIEERPKKEQDITDPENGFDVVIRRKGKGEKDTKYEFEVLRESTPLNPEVLQRIEEEDEALPNLTTIYDVVELKKQSALMLPPGKDDPFEDGDGAIDGDYREVEEPKKEEKKSKPRRQQDEDDTEEALKRLQQALAEEEDDEEEEEEEEDD